MSLRPPQRRQRARLRHQPHHPGPRPGTDGFLLPLAALMSLLLLLGSLSVQAVSLQGRLRGDTDLRMQESEDRLASAAQVLVSRIQLQHACLLPLPQEQWALAGCASPAELEALRQGEVLGARWQLLRWQPAPQDGTAPASQQRLSLEISLQPQGKQPPLRAAFELRLLGLPWRVQELRPLGLRGETP